MIASCSVMPTFCSHQVADIFAREDRAKSLFRKNFARSIANLIREATEHSGNLAAYHTNQPVLRIPAEMALILLSNGRCQVSPPLLRNLCSKTT